MEKLRKTTFFAMIPVALLIAAEGLIYFSSYGFSKTEVFLCTVENLCMAFIARPTVTAFNAFKAIKESYTPAEVLITKIYGALIIIAPILTTTAILAGFRVYIYDFFNSFKRRAKKNMYVIGDGSLAKAAATHYADEYTVHYLVPEKTSDKERLPLLRQKIIASPADYNHIQAALTTSKIEEADCVVLNFSDWFSRYKTATDLLRYLVQNGDESKTIPVYQVDAPKLYQDVFEGLFKGVCRKYNKPESLLDVYFADVSEWNVKHFFENPELTEQPDNKHHIVIVGFGRYGQAVLAELAKYMDDHGLWGTIEIFDRELERNLLDLIYATKTRVVYDSIEEVKTNTGFKTLSTSFTTEAGPLQVNYYQAVIGELKFAKIVESILSNSRITEVFFCIGDTSVNFEGYRMMLRYAEKHDNIRVYFRAGVELAETFEVLELASDKYRALPDGVADIISESEKEKKKEE